MRRLFHKYHSSVLPSRVSLCSALDSNIASTFSGTSQYVGGGQEVWSFSLCFLPQSWLYVLSFENPMNWRSSRIRKEKVDSIDPVIYKILVDSLHVLKLYIMSLHMPKLTVDSVHMPKQNSGGLSWCPAKVEYSQYWQQRWCYGYSLEKSGDASIRVSTWFLVAKTLVLGRCLWD